MALMPWQAGSLSLIPLHIVANSKKISYEYVFEEDTGTSSKSQRMQCKEIL
jgi:hypothetical protein